MNAAAANALYDAERNGVRQIRGASSDFNGGRCAWGVLWELKLTACLSERVNGCPLCGAQTNGRWTIAMEHNLVAHLNDDHEMTFSEIARKLGPDAA